MRPPPSPASSSSSSSTSTTLLTPPTNLSHLPSLPLSRSPSSFLDVQIPSNRISLDLQIPSTSSSISKARLGEPFPSSSLLPCTNDKPTPKFGHVHSGHTRNEEQDNKDIASFSTLTAASVSTEPTKLKDDSHSRSSRPSVSYKGNYEQWADLPWVFHSTLSLLEGDQPIFERPGPGQDRSNALPDGVGTPSLTLSAFLDENGRRASVFLPAPIVNSRRPSKGKADNEGFVTIPSDVELEVNADTHISNDIRSDLLVPNHQSGPSIATRQTRSPSIHLPWGSQVSLVDNHSNSRENIIHELASSIVASYPAALTASDEKKYPSPELTPIPRDRSLRRLASNFSLRTFSTYKKDDRDPPSRCDTPVPTLTKSLSRSLTFKALKNRFKAQPPPLPLPSIIRSENESSRPITPIGIPTFIPLAPPSSDEITATLTSKGLQSKVRLRRVKSSGTIKSDIMDSTDTINQATSNMVSPMQSQTRSPSVIERRSFSLLRRKPDVILNTDIITPGEIDQVGEGVRTSTSSFSIHNLTNLGPTPPRSISKGRNIEKSGGDPLFKTLFGPRPPIKVSSHTFRAVDNLDESIFDTDTSTTSISTSIGNSSSVRSMEVTPTELNRRPPTVLVELNTSPAFEQDTFNPTNTVSREQGLPSSKSTIDTMPDSTESRFNDPSSSPDSRKSHSKFDSRKSHSKFDSRPSTIALSLGPLPPLPLPGTPIPKSMKHKNIVNNKSLELSEDDVHKRGAEEPKCQGRGGIVSSPSEESFDRELEQMLESFAFTPNTSNTPTFSAEEINQTPPIWTWQSNPITRSSSSSSSSSINSEFCEDGGQVRWNDSSNGDRDRDRPWSYAFDLPHSRKSSDTGSTIEN